MKKFYSPFCHRTVFVLLFMLTFVRGWGQTETLACPAGTVVSNQMTFNTTNFTVIHAKGTDANFASFTPWRVYTDNTVTFTGGTGVQRITSIIITATTNAYAAAAAGGTFTVLSGTGSATGSSNTTTATITITGSDVKSIRLKPNAQSRWSSIVINYDAVSTCTPPATPTGTITGTTPACTSTILTYTHGGGQPEGGIDYYWQTSATGISMSNNASSTFTTTSPNNYVRAYNSATTCWSAPTANYPVVINSTINAVATLPTPTNSSTGVCYSGSGAVNSLSWTAAAGAVSYDVYFGAGSLPGTLTSNVTGTSYSVGTLLPNTTYYWRIVPRNGCGATTGTSVTWSFTTATGICYCRPAFTNNTDYIFNFGLGSITNNSSGFSAGGYGDFTSLSTNLIENSSYNASLTSSAGTGNHGVAIWIDFNNNGTFEPGERVGFLSNVLENTTVSVPITIPSGNIGVHRMRVVYQYNVVGTAIDPCASATYGEGEDYTINITAAPATPYSGITAGAGTEPSTISSLINTQAASSINFDFTVNDDANTVNGNDALPTLISQIVIPQGTGNDIANWTQAIAGAEITDGTNTLAGAVNATNITFGSINTATLGNIADGSNKTYVLKIWLNTAMGGTLPNTVDGQNLAFKIDRTNFTTASSATSTQFETGAGTAVESGANNNAITVVATKLAYLQQPSNTNTNTNMSPAVTVSANDTNGNRDLDYITAVTLTSTGTLTGTPVSATPTSGLATFGTLQHSAAGTGLKLTVASGSFTTLESNTFNIILVSAATDHFRSNVTTGTWATPASWQSSATGGVADSEWMTATLAPNASANSITIRAGHTITSSASAASRNMTIENSGILILNNAFTVNGANIINGTLTRNSAATTFTATGGSSLNFGATGIYNHNLNAAAIPTATWNVNSICNITGVTTSITLSSLNQTFGNFIWNNTVQNSPIDLTATVTNFNVAGNLTVSSTGTGAFSLNNSTTNKTINIGSLIVSNNSRFRLSFSTAASTGLTTVNVGNVTLNDNALLDFGGNVASGPIDSFYNLPVRGILNLSGNLTTSSTSTIEISGGNDSYGIINFLNSQAQIVDIKSGTTSDILFHVLPNSNVVLLSNIALGVYNGFDVEGLLDLGTHTITGADGDLNYFYNYPNSTLRIAHPDGIASLLSYPSTGAVRVDGNGEDYDISGNYVYYGTSNQNTGNGLPAIVKNISIENTGASGSNEVTLTNTELGVTEDLNVTNGIFNINDKEVFGGGVTTSDLRVSAGSELKIGGNRTFPVDFGTITFAPLSTIHYAGQDQTVAHVNTTTYANLPSYENLKISGTGIKSPVTDLTVNNIAIITAGTLQITETADNVQPHVFKANKGLQITGGNVILANNANLLQDVGAVNLGSVQAERKTSMKKMDYTYWSSPVQGTAETGQRLLNTTNANLETSSGGFSPTTPNNRIFRYNEPNDYFVGTTDSYFIPGKGYAIRGKNGYGTTKTADTFSFTGTPNNGDAITVTVQRSPSTSTTVGGVPKTYDHGFNLIGNPYPSGLNFNEFFNQNQTKITGRAWFWSNAYDTTNQTGSVDYLVNNYAVLTLLGGSPPTYGGVEGTTGLTPTENIKLGQGFIIQVRPELTSATTPPQLTFANSMRTTGSGSFFNNFKVQPENKDRFWVKLISPDHVVNTILLGYVPQATNNYDVDYDAELFTVGDDSFYSLLGSRKMQVEAKGTFVQESKIDLGTKQSKSGNYTIQLEQPEGIFANGQAIYLHDKVNGTYTNLLDQGYTFSGSKGIDETRFEIVYKNNQVLGSDGVKKSDFTVYRDGTSFVIKSSFALGKIGLYDVGGKLIRSTSTDKAEFRLDANTLPSGVYIIRAENSGNTRTKKIIK